jgi:hypothetical protein
VFEVLVKALFAARTLVVEMNIAEHSEMSTAIVRKRFGAWGRDIQFLQG